MGNRRSHFRGPRPAADSSPAPVWNGTGKYSMHPYPDAPRPITDANRPTVGVAIPLSNANRDSGPVRVHGDRAQRPGGNAPVGGGRAPDLGRDRTAGPLHARRTEHPEDVRVRPPSSLTNHFILYIVETRGSLGLAQHGYRLDVFPDVFIVFSVVGGERRKETFRRDIYSIDGMEEIEESHRRRAREITVSDLIEDEPPVPRETLALKKGVPHDPAKEFIVREHLGDKPVAPDTVGLKQHVLLNAAVARHAQQEAQRKARELLKNQQTGFMPEDG